MVIEGMENCPFCGGLKPQVAGREVIVRKEIKTKYYVVCSDCLCQTGLFDNPEDAVEMWNMRRGKQDGKTEWICALSGKLAFD